MAFRALLFSKSPETGTAAAAACEAAGIRAEVCSDIFTAIEKGKTRTFSCVIVDWADQPESSFLLKRARESMNSTTVAIAIVDRDPTAAELRENRLDFLISRPISPQEAPAVLTKAREQMQPMSAEDARKSFEEEQNASKPPANEDTSFARPEPGPDELSPSVAPETDSGVQSEYAGETVHEEAAPHNHGGAIGFREIFATALLLAAAFSLWSARGAVLYLAETHEGRFQVLQESLSAFLFPDKTGAAPVASAGADAQQDAYFIRTPTSNTQKLSLAVAATESALPESRVSLPKAHNFPLPQPVFEHEDVPPVHVKRVVIPDSMKNSAPIERPVVVTVNPALMSVSAPQQPQLAPQQVNEPVPVTEEAERALLVHMENPAYPQEALAQKLHGPVVLQATIARDGSVQDLKLVRGYFVLSKAAIAAVKQWRFQPYTVAGHPAATQTQITVNFTYPPTNP